MRKSGPISLALLANLALNRDVSAQLLTWYGTNTCFTSLVWVQQGGGFSNSACPQTTNTIRLSWGFSSGDRSAYEFTRSSPPQGPGDQGIFDPVPLGFTNPGDVLFFSLGSLTYQNAVIEGVSSTHILDYANLSFELFLDGSSVPTWTYLDLLKLDNQEDGGTDFVTMSGGSAQLYSLAGHQYRFSVAGFDKPGEIACGASGDVDALPQDLTAAAGASTSKEICGRLEYLGVTPEPVTLVLVGTALVGLAGAGVIRRRRTIPRRAPPGNDALRGTNSRGLYFGCLSRP